MRGEKIGWVVVIPKDDLVPSALLSGGMIQTLSTSGSVIAMISSKVSFKHVTKLKSVFDFTIVGETNLGWCVGVLGFDHSSKEGDGLLVECLNLTSFSKLIVMNPGILVLRQADKLFETCGMIRSSSSSSSLLWGAWIIQPNSSKYKKAQELLRVMPSYKLEDMAKVIFGHLVQSEDIIPDRVLLCEELKTYTGAADDVLLVEFDNTFLHGEVSAVRALAQGTNEFPSTEWEKVLRRRLSDVYEIAFSSSTEHSSPKSKEPLLCENNLLGSRESKDWIAIVGMACRFPQANSLEEYWDILHSGRNTSSSPPPHRLPLSSLDEDVKANFLKCRIDEFDAQFFGISPSELNYVDAQTRLLLEVSWEALEDAGINPEKLRNTKTGVFYGSWLQDYKEVMNTETAPGEEFLRKYLGNGFGCTSAKLSFFYGFTGPNIATESGCSSSIMAVDLASKSLLRGECPVAVAAGANVLLQLNLRKKVVWAEDGLCKTFDASGNGYGRAEGVGVLILKRYADAIRDGDKVEGIIRGSSSSQEGLSRSFGTPTVDSETEAMRGALMMAKVDPGEVDYLEAHATGTGVGDPIEAAAIVNAYSSSSRAQPLWIASGKTNIGHTESCSGIAAIIKVLLAMKHEEIPAHINLELLNPKVNFDSIPGKIPLSAVEWPRRVDEGRARLAGVSSFGITGTDVHMILQEGPINIKSEVDHGIPASPQILTLSAKCESALEDLTSSYLQYFERASDDDPADIVYTSNACRAHHPFRRAVIGSSLEVIAEQLRSGSYASGNNAKINSKPSKICFAFPGMIGSMNLEPAALLYRSSPVFRMHMNYCNEVYLKTVDEEVSILMYLTKTEPSECKRNVGWYASILAVQYSLTKLWERWNIKPDCVMGHSLGEIAAAIASGSLALEDGFRMMTAVKIFIETGETNPGAMLAINCQVEKIEELKSDFEAEVENGNFWIDVGCINSRSQTVVVGVPDTIHKFKNICKAQGLQSKFVTVDFPLHSRGIEPALEKCRKIASEVNHHPSKLLHISSVTGEQISPGDQLTIEYWFKCFRDTVQFTEACEASQKLDCDIYLEIGLGDALTKLIQENTTTTNQNQPLCLSSFNNKDDRCWSGLLTTLSQLYVRGSDVNWEQFYQFQPRNKVRLPHYPFQRKSYWFERKGQRDICDSIEKMQLDTFEQLHPLLGYSLSNASDKKIYQNFVSLKKVPFIFDHVIGHEVIFPAAAFLEMILAVGQLSISGDKELTVDNFNVHLPLHLESSVRKKVQTLMHQKEGCDNTLEISIHAFSNDECKMHASATIKLSEMGQGQGQQSLSQVEVNEIIKNSSALPETTVLFYNQAAKAGLNFGPEFQSLQEIHRNLTDTLVRIKFPNEDNEDTGYVCHPIVMDAMLQCYILHTKPELNKLHVPIRVGQFSLCKSLAKICQDQDPESGLYAYCKSDASGVTKAVYLLDTSGTVLGTMMHPELTPTTVESVLKAAGVNNHKVSNMPNVYEVFWKPSQFYQLQLPSKDDFGGDMLAHPDFHKLTADFEESNKFSAEEKRLDEDINRLCYFYVLKALYDLGWDPEVGRIMNVDDLEEQFNITASLQPAFRHYLTYLQENGILKQRENEIQLHFVVKECPPIRDEVHSEIEKLVSSLQDYGPINVIHSCGSQLVQILQGNVSGQYILFGSETNGLNPAEFYYQTTRLNYGMFQAPAQVFMQVATQIFSSLNKVVRILEVGAGTGTFTKQVLPALRDRGISYEYHFTDISPSFFSRASAKFTDHKSQLVYKTLDIEKDPLRQGFPPEYFDILVGVDVFHATRDLNKTMRNIQTLTKRNGVLIMGETDVPTKELDVVFGILDGYWLFEDKDIRPNHCTITSDKWLELMRRNGFSGSSNKVLFATENQMSVIIGQRGEDIAPNSEQNMGNGRKWLILHDHDAGDKKSLNWLQKQFKKQGRRVEILALGEVINTENVQNQIFELLDNGKDGLEGILYIIQGSSSEPNSRHILEPLLHISKYFLQSKSNSKQLPKLHVATRGSFNTGEENLIEKSGPSSAILWGFARCLRIELPTLLSKCIDLDPDSDNPVNYSNLFNELWLEDKETEILFRNGARLVRRLRKEISISAPPPTLSIPNSPENRYKIEIPTSKILQDLKYVANPTKQDTTLDYLGEDKVEVEVRCASLNFKDVLVVMKPSRAFDSMNVIGLDYSGVVTAVGRNVRRWTVGDPVFGCSWKEGAIASHIQVDQNFLMKMTDNVTFGEAATLPAVFLTAWYCMANVANLKPGQTILVHAASGGVGLIAIQIAKLLGAKVIGTAGSHRKRNFIRNLGVEHVSNSRNTDYEGEIMKITEGQGVDMVLNCLTGPGFKEASLNVLREGGHFVEISKLDIWQPSEVEELRPNVNYNIVDATQVELPLLQGIFEKLTTLLKDGSIAPLPYTRYSGSNIVDALTFLQKAKQIGKVIVEMPQFQGNQFKDNLFNERSTYMITGGMGAIGFAVTKWMISEGAKYLVLVGRSPPSQEILEEIGELESSGATVICKQADISNYDDCEKLLKEIGSSTMPPLRGIHHCSGVLSDKLISSREQDWDNFEYVLAPKVAGAYNLHQLTLSYRLQCFVVYSSMSATFGNIGQSNYAAGNAYMDSLIEMRNLMGLKGTSINWGQWKAGLAENLELEWVDGFSIDNGISTLDHLCRKNKVSAVVGNVKFSGIMKMCPSYEATLFELEELRMDSSRSDSAHRSKSKNKNGDQRRKALLKDLYFNRADAEGNEIVRSCVVDILCETLGVKSDELDEDTNFTDMGMDSLMSIEFTNKLQSELNDVTLGFVDMEEHGTVGGMTQLLTRLLDSHREENGVK